MHTNDSKPLDFSMNLTAHLAEGKKLAGCYGLKRRISNADDAVVWLAHDEVLGKDVSLHFVPEILLGDSEAMGRLRQDVKRNRQLIHPNILRVYDLVEEEGWAAISMDDFEGESLAALLAKKNGTCLDPEEMQPWFTSLCTTLDDAHKINILHGDLAPVNLFLTGEGKLLVANFGLAGSITDAVWRISGKSSAQLAVKSPQQVDGAQTTRADDVYGLGVLLFQSLTGRLPFVGDDLVEQVRNSFPPLLADLRDVGASKIGPEWQKTISACLEKKPEARPQTVLDVARLLVAEGSEKTTPTKADVVAKTGIVTSTVAIPNAPKLAAEPLKTNGKPTGETPAAPAPKKAVFEAYPGVASERSRGPAWGFAVAAALVVIGVIGYNLNDKPKDLPASDAATGLAPAEQPEGLELRSVNNKVETPIISKVDVGASPLTENVKSTETGIAPVVVSAATPKPTSGPVLMAAAATPPPKIAPTIPPAQAAPTAESSEEEKILAGKLAALEKARQSAAAAEKSREDMTKQRKQAEAAVAEAEKALEQKAKALAPIKKAADDVLLQRKSLENEQRAADLAAEQARQLATEKSRAAEMARKAISDLEVKNKEKLVAQDKATAEIQVLEKTLADKQQVVAGAAKTANEVEAERAKHLAAIKLGEQEVEQAKELAAEARRLREEAEAERRKLALELSEMQKLMEKKKAEIEERLKKLETPAKTPAALAPAAQPVPVPEVKPATPLPAPQSTSTTPSVPVVSPVATPAPVAVVPKPATPTPSTPGLVNLGGKPAPITPPPALVMKTEPVIPAVASPAAQPKSEAVGTIGENTLALKFVPVGDVEFCVWQTRVKDFEVFAKAVNLKSSAWRGPGFKQGPDHPVVNVTWVEAVAFCKWLTDLEHKEGILPATQYYRLPTDLEWSKAVGLQEESGKTPEARDMGVADVFPWGTQWPPPPASGNYTGEETGSDVAIKGYDDGFAWTSPVGSFPPNKLGLYDMGGNVWQWCMDPWNNDSKAKVLRGASWYNGALKLSLLSSCRVHASPESSTDNYGFRIVRASDSNKAGKR